MNRQPNKCYELTCSVCQNLYTVGQNPATVCGICPKCQQRQSSKKFRSENPGRYSGKMREWRLKFYYGLSLEQYDELLEKQQHKCAICGTLDNRGHPLCVDHNHSNGMVRGLLCHRCNQGIGLLDDNTVRATRYLMANAKLSWHDYFMNMAILASSRSKDRSTKVGALIVNDRVIVSTGYNGFPRGVNDDIEERHTRPLKYEYTSHAEENAILNAARIGAKVAGSDIYVTWNPCARCSRAIIQSQIKTVYILDTPIPDRWKMEFETSREMLNEAGVKIEFMT